MSAPPRQLDPAKLRPDAAIWGPLFVGIVALFFAFPAGLALAILNWQRMGLLAKARRHLFATVIGAYVFVLFVLLVPGGLGFYLYPAVNIGVFFYLRREIDQDADAYAHAGKEARPASWGLGLLLGVGFGLALALLYVVVAIFLDTTGLL